MYFQALKVAQIEDLSDLILENLKNFQIKIFSSYGWS